MATLAIDEAPFDIPEEESLALMIEGVLGELAFEVEITEARVNVEGDVSSSTPANEDIEDEDATKEV